MEFLNSDGSAAETTVVNVPAEGRISYDTNLGGKAVRITSNSQNIYVTQKAIVNGSLNEYAGIARSAMTTEYYFPAYSHNGSNFRAFIKVGNPNGSAEDVTLEFLNSDGTAAETTVINVPANGRISYDTNLGGKAVRVTSNSQDIYVTQKAIVSGSLNEYPGISTSLMATQYFFPAYAHNGSNLKAFIKIGNPNGTAENVTLEFMNSDGSVAKTTVVNVPANGRVSYDTILGGKAVRITANSQNVYVTLKAIANGSLNEYGGVSN